MPPFATRTLELLTRRTPLTSEEWFTLVGDLPDLYRSVLDCFDLPILGELPCLRGVHGNNRLRDGQPVCTGDERFSLLTQGIFERQAYSAAKSAPRGTMLVWGLTCDRTWVITTVHFDDLTNGDGVMYQRARVIEIEESDLRTIVDQVKVEPTEIWRVFGHAIREVEKRQRQLHESAKLYADAFAFQEAVLSLLPKS